MEAPEVRCAKSGDVSIAYSVVGDGSFDVIFVSGACQPLCFTGTGTGSTTSARRGTWGAGDGFFASFDGPARAIRCACAITEAVRELGLGVRTGLHTGECELLDGKVGGIAVHIGARVAAEAVPGEVLVSSTVKDLVAGSGIEFRERGFVELKGVPGEWRLYSVEQSVGVD